MDANAMREAFLNFIADSGMEEQPDGDTDGDGHMVDCTTYRAPTISRPVFEELAEAFGFVSDWNGSAWDKILRAIDEPAAFRETGAP